MESLKKQILKGILQAGLTILTIFSTAIFMGMVGYFIVPLTVIWSVLILISRPIFLLEKVRMGKYLDFDKMSTYFYIFSQYMFFLFLYVWLAMFICEEYVWLFYVELFIVLGIIMTALTNIKPSKILLANLILYVPMILFIIIKLLYPYIYVYYLINAFVRQGMLVYYTSFLKKNIKDGGTIKEKKDLILNIFLEMIPMVILVFLIFYLGISLF